MSKVEKFSEFTNEGVREFGSKMRRVVTGQSAGDELEKLQPSQKQKLVELYIQDPREAAKYLRSIIIKEKNSQFGLGLALAIAGSAMIYKAANIEPPPPPKPLEDNFIESLPGEGQTQFLNRVGQQMGYDFKLNPQSSPEEFMDAVAKVCGKGDFNQGVENLFAGVSEPGKSTMVNAMQSMASNPHGRGDTLGEIFSGDWAPHKMFGWGDQGVSVIVPK